MMLTSILNRMAPLVYHPDGERLMRTLWEETMNELAFARVREIVGGLSNGQVPYV